MTEYISREAALEAIQKHKEEMAKTGGVSNRGKAFYLLGQDHAIDVLRIVPAADVKPVVRGEWEDCAVKLDLRSNHHDNKCPNCGYPADYFICGSEDWWCAYEPNICPRCGAYIRREAKDDSNL